MGNGGGGGGWDRRQEMAFILWNVGPRPTTRSMVYGGDAGRERLHQYWGGGGSGLHRCSGSLLKNHSLWSNSTIPIKVRYVIINNLARVQTGAQGGAARGMDGTVYQGMGRGGAGR